MKTLITLILVLSSSSLSAADIIRYANTGSSLPIANAVEVDGVLYHSGVVPSALDSNAQAGSVEYWGNTEVQTDNVLGKIKASLEAKGMSMGDVVKLTVFLVGDPAKENRLDFGGFMAAYNRYFGEASEGNLPARSVVQVAGLVQTGMLVEIEAIAVRK